MASVYSHQSYNLNQEVLVKREEDYSNSLEEFLGGDSAVQRPQVNHDPSPFLYSNSYESGQVERDKVSVTPSDLPVSDMDLAGFLDMDDKTLSELAGVDSSEWTTLFNGQLDDVNLVEQTEKPSPTLGGGMNQLFGMGMLAGQHQLQQPQQQPQQQPPTVDRWLVEETQKLERQQRIQQQKLLELQQTLLKTEILKNQLQIATISQGQASSPTSMSSASTMLLGTVGNGGLPHQQPHPQQQQDMSANSPGSNGSGMAFLQGTSSLPGSNCSSNPVSPSVSVVEPVMPEMSSTPSPALQPQPMLTNSNRNAPIITPSPLLSKAPGNKPEVKTEVSSVPNSPEPSEDDSPKMEPNKRKVHNLIEKKYRCSINDRICLLRDMVSKNSKDNNKKLQKSAVLQKTIDFIHHLQNTIKKLQEENQRLREALARATGSTCVSTGSNRLPSYSSPPNTPSGTPNSYESERDSGDPSSPDSNSDGMASHNSSPSSKNAFFSQFLRNPVRPIGGAASQYLMMVMLVAVFFVNPLSLSGYGGPSSLHVAPHSTGHARSLNTFEDMAVLRTSSAYSVAYLAVWALRFLVALVCFGWMALKAMPRVIANSNESVQFWRFRKQADNDIEEGDFISAKENLEVALCSVNRPLPSSYPALVTGLLWNFLCHLVYELVIGRYAVLFASYFVRAESWKNSAGSTPKLSTVVGVSFRDISEAYHLLLQIGLSSSSCSHMYGMNFFLGLNALNLAEADRPFKRLSQSKRAEMYFTMGLCSHYTFPYSSSLPMWYYFFRYRVTSSAAQATPLRWAVTPPGKAFLMSSKWATEVDISPKIYSGTAALPTYAVTRSFCKELLCETFHYLLLPDDSPSSQASRDSDVAVQAFKLVLKLAKEAMCCLSSSDGCKSSLNEMACSSDSGFAVIRWWASVGIVSCYWLSGKDSAAEDYYANIEALSGEMGAAVPSCLQLAFKANRLYKRQDSSSSGKKVPVQLVLQLCATTSNSLKSSVANLLQDQSNSTDSELHQLGLLQACDWLLSLKVTLWENHGKENKFSENLCPGFYQDLETLAKLITLLPSAKSRLHLYKGCYQLIAGANPLLAHAMLNSTGNTASVRRRGNKDGDSHNPALCSHEHAMAKVMAYKHLPPSMESPYSLSPPPSPSRRQSPILQSSPAHA